MKVILEGCECTGKSTLAKRLAEKYGLDIVHITSKDPNTKEFYEQTMKKSNVVFDRHFIGEMIYPGVYSRPGNLDSDGFEQLLVQSGREKVAVIVMHADFDTILDRYVKRGRVKDQFIIDKFRAINDKFYEIAQDYSIRVVDVEKDSFEDICQYIEGVCE